MKAVEGRTREHGPVPPLPRHPRLGRADGTLDATSFRGPQPITTFRQVIDRLLEGQTHDARAVEDEVARV